MILLLTGLAFGADCPQSTTSSALEDQLAEARRGLERLDQARFVAATDAIDRLLPCLGEPISRHLAAEVHRTRGIRAVTDRDPDASRMFAAARTLEPAYKFPSTLIPEGNPVRVEYAAFDLAKGTFETLRPPSEGTLQLDGRSQPFRPNDWPTVAQYLNADGGVVWTSYLMPGTPMPAYPALAEGQTAVAVNPLLVPDPNPPTPVPMVPARQANPKVPLAIAAGTSAVLTGVLYGLAGASEARFKDPTTLDAELDGLRSRANSLVIVSAFSGTAALGLGVATIAVR